MKKMDITTLTVIIALVSLTFTLSISYALYNRVNCSQWVEIDTGTAVYRERLCVRGTIPTRFEIPNR